MSEFCIGWIPHLIGAPFLTNRWIDLIDADVLERERAFEQWKKKNPNKKEEEYVRCEKRDEEKFFYKLKRKGSKKELGHPFLVSKIGDIGYTPAETTLIKNIKATLENGIYVAACRSVDDTATHERVFFVYHFTDESFETLKEVFLFKRQRVSHDPKNIILLYRASIIVDNITNEGFITLHTSDVADIILNQDVASEKYSIQTFIAITDILHCHTHHHNHTQNSTKKSFEPTDVPDSLVSPIWSPGPLDQKATAKILAEYRYSLLSNLEGIADLVHRTDVSHESGLKKINIHNGYPEIMTFIKQARGILLYTNQLLQDMKSIKHIDDAEYAKQKETLQNIHSSFQDFQDTLECRFQANIAGVSELLLIITALLTMWLIILEINKDSWIPSFVLGILIAITIAAPCVYVYYRFFKQAV